MRIRSLAAGSCLLLIATTALSAQTPFKAGENYIGPSISLSSYGSTADIAGNFEHAINDKWGWGVSVGYFSYGIDHYNYKVIPVAGTVAYHFDVHNEKLDPFVGGSVGYFIYSCSSDFNLCGSVGAKSSGLLIGGYGGVRYWTTEKLALTARVGFGLGILAVGVDFKI